MSNDNPTHVQTVINGRTITYARDTEFLVQTGVCHPRAPYRTIRRFIGNPEPAVQLYENIKLAPGRRKRLLMPTSSYPTILEEKREVRKCVNDLQSR